MGALEGVFLGVDVQVFGMFLQLVQTTRLGKFWAREGRQGSPKMSASQPPCHSLPEDPQARVGWF